MAIPSLTSIIYGAILASIMIIGMTQFYVGTYDSYNPDTRLLANDNITDTHDTFLSNLKIITEPFKETNSTSFISGIPVIGGAVNFGLNLLWSLGLFIVMPAQLLTLITTSFAGTSLIIPTEIGGIIGVALFFFLIVGIIRVLTQRGEI